MTDFTSDPQESSRRPFLNFLGVSVLCLGLFLWLKLRLVSSVPKTAYAEPEPAREQTQSQPLPAEPHPLTATEKQLPPEVPQPDLIR
ncbi:MAG: hypothetical protein ACOYN0_04130 [Phycisphaerales bacterium]